jgi:hypothetical protein
MAPADEGGDRLLVLLILLLLDGADEPELYDLLRYVEDDIDRLFARSPRFRDFRGRAPPRFLIRRLIERRARRSRSLDFDFEGSDRTLALVSEVSARLDRQSSSSTQSILEVQTSLTQFSANFAELSWALSIGSKLEDIKMKRNIPVRIYLPEGISTSAIGNALINSIFESLSEFGIEKSTELPAETGSWWKQVWGRTKEALSQEEVAQRLEKLEHAASLKLIDKPQADITKSDADAASKMIKSLEHIPSACVQIGNLLIIKRTPRKGDPQLIVRTLTALELIALEKNKAILKSPNKVIDLLDKHCQPPGTLSA